MKWSKILHFFLYMWYNVCGDDMKKGLKLTLKLLFFVFIIMIILFNEQITTYIVKNYVYNKNVTLEISKNEYSLNRNYEAVQITDDFIAHDYQHLLNIMYTILDSGNKEFAFFCDDKYTDCLSDLDNIIPSDDSNKYDILADINNLVHPYNSYTKLTVIMNNYGKVIVKISKQYTDNQIKYINEQVDKIDKEIIKSGMTNKQKLQAFHDYIINTTKYDKERANDMDNRNYKNSISHTAYGLLKNHIALCGGYSDIMSIFAAKYNIQNMRISADKHVWNLVNLDNKWYHIDATWDDPITNTGSQILIEDYFLINTESLHYKDSQEHNFNANFYKEAK